jgi:hypothetical protein
MEYRAIYEKLKQHDRTLTEERFSIDYLNRSKHYLSMCKATGRDISSEAKLNLWLNLLSIGNTWAEISASDSTGELQRANYNARLFAELANEVILTIKLSGNGSLK